MPMTFAEALAFYSDNEPRGEYVLVIEGKSIAEKKAEEAQSWKEMPIEEHMKYYEQQNIDKKEAMKLVARDRGIGKRDVYDMLLNNKK